MTDIRSFIGAKQAQQEERAKPTHDVGETFLNDLKSGEINAFVICALTPDNSIFYYTGNTRESFNVYEQMGLIEMSKALCLQRLQE